MKKRSAKKQAKDSKPREDSEITCPMEVPLRAPTRPGSPLRVEEFPTLEEVARLSCLLANGSLPTSPDTARKLAAAALEVWRGCRDELTEAVERSATYWKSRDESATRLSEAHHEVNAFLSQNKGNHLIGANRVSWDEAIAVLAVASSKKAATAELKRIVSTHLVGSEFYSSWNLNHFEELGFDPLSFPTVILSVAEERARLAAEARSAAMREKARIGVEKRKAKKEAKEWGKLSGKAESIPPRKNRLDRL